MLPALTLRDGPALLHAAKLREADMDALLDAITRCSLVATAIGVAYLLCVMAAVVDHATGKRWGLVTLAVAFATAALIAARMGCAP